MKSFIAIFLTLSACLCCGEEPGVEKRIESVYAEVDTAIIRKDPVALDRLLTRNFIMVHAAGGMDPRPAFLKRIALGTALQRQFADDYAEFDTSIDVFGDAAIRRSRARFRFTKADRELWLLQTRIFVKSGAVWQMAAHHGSRFWEGKIVDVSKYRDLAGEYRSADGSLLLLRWHGGGIVAEWPDNGMLSQIFPFAEGEWGDGARRLRFAFDTTGRATDVIRVDREKEVWRGRRTVDTAK